MAEINLNDLDLKSSDREGGTNDKREDRLSGVDPAALKRHGEGKPSAYYAELKAKLRHKKRLTVGDVPVFIHDAVMDRAQDKNMNVRQYIFDLLRKDGLDIPPEKDLDLRLLNSRT